MIMIDARDRRPIYEQIISKLSDLMVRGVLQQDEKLPSVRNLATELSINPNTIQRAYIELERRGYIYSVKGRGSFVADTKEIRSRRREKIFDELGLLIEQAKSANIPKNMFIDKVTYFYGGFALPAESKGGSKDDRS